eukprot:TRINITY_DN3272_c0_g1_i1.p1 TRINITY_DN3272_c0_g1~~TRINITY_DN3272_c0_g1_i1.p1  ORF type:complete len:141 (+),score=41.62 TRINITY_DN3272_c0_g1_i1:96-518(+)
MCIRDSIHTGYGDKYAADFCNKDYTSEKEISSALEADLALVVPLPCARVIYQHYHAPAPAAKVPPLNLEELPEQGGSEGQRKEGDKRRAVDDELESSEGEPVTPRAEATQRTCLLYTSDAADEEDSVDLGGRRVIKKKNR